MIRCYETIGRLPEAARKDSGYRDYEPTDVNQLAFVRRARDLGFSIDRIRELLLLWCDRGNADVRAIANAHISDLQDQAAKLEEMIVALQHVVRICRGRNRDECPIMADLSRGPVRRRLARKRGRAVSERPRPDQNFENCRVELRKSALNQRTRPPV
jgi:DNA-binding transcriptional MerR regulator